MGKEYALNISFDFRSISSLTNEERILLRELTNKTPPRSIFQQWLDHLHWVDYIYIAILRIDGVIRGWAAASLVADWNRGQVGVFIHSDFRGLGRARNVLKFLLTNIKEKVKDSPEYFEYQLGLSRLFSEPISQSGFKDVFVCREEYLATKPVIKF